MIKCSVCDVSIESDRLSLISHYRSDWHKHNLSRTLQGRPILSEEEFEQLISDEEELSDIESMSEDDNEQLLTCGVHEYFVHESEVFSIYNAILANDESLSSEFFRKPLDCAIFMVAGGHFTGGIFKNNEMIAHKSYHRYTVRAKQGGTQSGADSKGGKKAKSAGATLRRYNEKMLKEDIQEVIAKWNDEIKTLSLIFIRCSSYHRPIFLSDSLERTPFLRNDPRLRSIPFETRRPSQQEMERTWTQLKNVYCYGSVEEFRKELLERNKQRKKKRRILRKKLKTTKNLSLNEISSDDGERSNEPFNNKGDDNILKIIESHKAAQNASQSQNVEWEVSGKGKEDGEEKHDELTKAEMQSVYMAVRSDSEEQLSAILSASDERRVIFEKYIRETRFPPNTATFLHIAAGRGALHIIPVSQNRETRQVFSQYRMENVDRYDWNQSQIPELVVMSEEKLAKELEKRRLQRERKRQREKEKKAEQRVERAIQAEKEKFLALSDREKRAIAAERRLAASLQTRLVVVADDGNRCFEVSFCFELSKST
ncbi:unnamed protein product [Anisakis simplex]|uniref:BVLRF1 domain-containing protein n=1 Tax=Anisakis simplex TaxID=6269 RepID=A0A0M3K676_ANISI|nr:unnamed protein product [Anisakis simplex]